MRGEPAVLPMTVEVRAILRDAVRSAWRPYAIGLVAGGAVLLVLGIVVGGTKAARADDVVKFLGLLVGTYAGLVALLFAIDILALWRDLRSSDYLRDTGLVSADEEWDYRFFYKLTVNGVQLRSPWKREGEAPFSVLKDASVDHTRHAHLVLAIRDSDGRAIYLKDGYRP